MASKATKSELITGLFAALVIGSFIAVVLFLQAWAPQPEGDRYRIRFTNAGGLRMNAPVLVAGQRVGNVEDIDAQPVVDAEGQRGVVIIVTVLVHEEYSDIVNIPADTVASVQSGGLFSGNQLVFNLGSSSEVVAPGDSLPMEGRPPVEFGDLMNAAGETIEKLDSGLQKFTALLDKQENYDNIEAALASLRSALHTLDEGLETMGPAFSKVGPALESSQELLSEIRSLVEANTESINNTMVNLESASGRLNSLLEEEGGVTVLVANLNSIANNLEDVLGNVNELVLDNQLNVGISIQNIRETTQSLRYFARRIEADPSLLVWGGSEEQVPGLDRERAVPNVDEMTIRNSGRRPRKESD